MAIELCSMGQEVAVIGGASGLVGTLVALLWALLGSKVDVDMAVVQRISLPVLMAGMLLFPFFDGPGRVVCGGMIIAALAHSTIVGWCTTSIDNYEFRLHPVDRFALRQTPSYLDVYKRQLQHPVPHVHEHAAVVVASRARPRVGADDRAAVLLPRPLASARVVLRGRRRHALGGVPAC